MRHPEDAALVGSIVANRFRVGEILGSGSVGTAFAVKPLAFPRPLVMKVLRPRVVTSDLIARVIHGEARSAWGIPHPCLCEVVDAGVLEDGSHYFVMDRFEGETLADRVARDPMSVASATDAMMQILSALVAVHARDQLLRDLRPKNIFLAHRRGCRPLVKIMDFGLARLSPIDRVYASPERLRGELEVEVPHDLYITALVFYEALSGQRPAAIPMPLHEQRRDIPPELSAFVARGLSANPKARFLNAKDMQDELRAVFEGAKRASSIIAAAVPVSVSLMPAHPPLGAEKDEETSTDGQAVDIGAFLGAGGIVEKQRPEVTVDVTFDEPVPTTKETFGQIEEDQLALGEEEETETMKLTPELRAHIEKLSGKPLQLPKPLPAPVPPPPRRR